MTNARKEGFTQAIGRWLGTAEVYDGNGRFLGNGTDRRHVQKQVGENRVRIDLSFVGPFKFAGHYFIEDCKTHRLYQGPANVGYAETLSSGLIEANAYWSVVGLSQRFFLMVLPDGNRQMSLALMSRGEELIYVVVGEYHRVAEDGAVEIPAFVNGTSYDFADDVAGGRGEILLHRNGRYAGALSSLDGDLKELAATDYSETMSDLSVGMQGLAFAPGLHSFDLVTNGCQAWTGAGQVVGSYSLSGGRALSGQFHFLDEQLRLWRREVVSHDGMMKVVVHIWYRGGQRVGVQFGVLDFEG